MALRLFLVPAEYVLELTGVCSSFWRSFTERSSVVRAPRAKALANTVPWTAVRWSTRVQHRPQPSLTFMKLNKIFDKGQIAGQCTDQSDADSMFNSRCAPPSVLHNMLSKSAMASLGDLVALIFVLPPANWHSAQGADRSNGIQSTSHRRATTDRSEQMDSRWKAAGEPLPN